jgi:AcrR family transcriptional regulator
MAEGGHQYHHGDLRSALIEAALAIVETQGMAALSLRSLARAVGVSGMAPYHHFKDRAALVAAVAAAGFEQLFSAKQAALAAASDSPDTRLVAGMRSYVGFVLDHRELYRLMGSPELANRAAYPTLAGAAAAPAASLKALAVAAQAAGLLGNADPGAVATQLWAFSHGLAQLVIDGYVGLDRDAALRLVESGTIAMLAGYAALKAAPAG